MVTDSTHFLLKIKRLFPALLLALAVTSTAEAQNSSVSLDINDDALRLAFQQIRPARKVSLDASVFNHQDRGTILTAGFHITGNAATKARPINAGLGGRVVYAKVDNNFLPDELAFINGLPGQDGYAVAVGGFFNGKVPNYDRIGFGGHVYFAPDVLALGDLEEFADATLYASYSVLRNADVYLGVRVLKGDFKEIGDYNFDTGMHIGFTLKF